VEEEVHYGSKTYDEVISKRRGKPVRRIVDEEKAREEAWKIDEEEAIAKAVSTNTSTLSELVEEEPTMDNKRRKKEKVQKKK
jgi:hypothetical protein